MREKLSISVKNDDPLAIQTDLLAVQYPQRLYGLINRVVELCVSSHRHVLLPQRGVVRFLEGVSGIAASRLLIVGVAPVSEYDYRDLRAFVHRALSHVSAITEVQHVVLPAYGPPAYRLDDSKAFEAEVAGIVDAIRDTRISEHLRAIDVAERDPDRATRLRDALGSVFNSAMQAAKAARGDRIPAESPRQPHNREDEVSHSLFVCYRRDDAPDAAGRIYDSLADAFGRESVFMDIDNIPLGVNFVSYISQQLHKCAAVLVIIGRDWATIQDVEGHRRIDDPADHVRVEIATALQQGIPLIPVLVQNATMPRAAELPEDIRDLAFHNGIRLAPEFWRGGVERLIRELDRVMKG